MKIGTSQVVLAVTMMFTDIKQTEPDRYTSEQWAAIADALDAFIVFGEEAEKINKETE